MRLLLFILCVVPPISGWTNPSDAVAHSGNIQIQEMGPLLEIRAPDRSVIDWNSFSISTGETTRFIQPTATSAVLNRVVGNEMSQILGELQANGKVYLVNPNGIVIGKEGQISAASFIGSTLSVAVDEFLAGGAIHFSGEEGGEIINLGTIKGTLGSVVLLAQKIRNKGLTEAKNGVVHFGAGREILLDPTGDGLIFIRPNLGEGGIEQEGVIEGLEIRLQAEGPYGIAIGRKGEATMIVRENGNIYLSAEEGPLTVGGESLLRAPRGDITLLGKKIQVEQALIDVSGNEGGGTVLIGGKGSQETAIQERGIILADALSSGSGGDILIWSEEKTLFDGLISARGFEEGGFVEVSGKGGLNYRGFADLSPIGEGKFGKLLLDPKNITIDPGGGAFTNNYTFGDNPGTDVTISGSNLETAINSASVILQANTDIFVQDTVTASTLGNGLTLQAGRSITFSAAGQISLNQAPFSAVINDNGAVSNRDAGNAAFTMSSGSSIATNGGSISITHGSNTGGNVGAVALTGATLNAGDGDITITGDAPLGSGVGVNMGSSVITMTGTHAITITGSGDPTGTSNSYGIGTSSTNITISNGSLSMTGVAQADGTGTNNNGINIASGTISSTGTGSITLHGTAGPGVDGNIGTYINGTVSTVSGPVSITGIANTASTGNSNFGVYLYISSDIHTTDSATITINGTGGSGTYRQIGCWFNGNIYALNTGNITINGTGGSGYFSSGHYFDNSSVTSVVDGTLHVIGYGNTTSPGDDYGLWGIVSNFGQFSSTGSGPIIFEGTGGTAGGSFTFINYGVYLNGGTVASQGTGPITITGVGGLGSSEGNGLYFNNNAIVQSTGSGSVTLTGTPTGPSSRGVAIYNGSSISTATAPLEITAVDSFFDSNATFYTTGVTAGTGNITITAAGNPAINMEGTITTVGGNITLNGTGTSGSAIVASGTLQSTGVGSITLNGISGSIAAGTLSTAGTTSGEGNITLTGTGNPGISITGGITTVGGDIVLTGTGTGATGITIGGPLLTTGVGDIFLESGQGDLSIGATLTTSLSGDISLLALNGNSSISIDADFSCGGLFMVAANNNITIGNAVLVSLTGAGSFVTDQQNGTTYVAPPTTSGVFTNNGTITSVSNNLAIYCVYGPQEPTYAPAQSSVNVFGNLSPSIETWDTYVSSPPLSGKYATSYSSGGPVHGPGFDNDYTPGNGVFGSAVVWYKETFDGPVSVRIAQLSDLINAALTQTIANQADKLSNSTDLQPSTTPNPKKGCRSPAVAVQAL